MADKGGLAGILIGAAVGAFIGAAIGNKLDEKEQKKAAEAARKVAESKSDATVTWSSDDRPTKVFGYAEPVKETPVSASQASLTSDAATVSAPPNNAAAPTPPVTSAPAAGPTSSTTAQCRRIRQVHYVEGKETSEESRYCLKAGQWQKA